MSGRVLTLLVCLLALHHGVVTRGPPTGGGTSNRGDPPRTRAPYRSGRERVLSRRVAALEEHSDQLLREVRRLQAENIELKRDLKSCGCVPVWCRDDEGKRHRSGETWDAGHCRTCLCKNNGTVCTVPATPECGSVHECSCQNGGFCGVPGDSEHCICPEGFHGDHCQHPHSNPCIFLPSAGSCGEGILVTTVHTRGSLQYYYDWNSQTCKVFNYTGCGGSANKFVTREQCEKVCLIGACCVRHVTHGERAATSHQCLDVSLEVCRGHAGGSPLEVVSFHPQSSCLHTPCGGATSTQWTDLCPPRCESLIERRDIRDLSLRDRWQFQQAVGMLSRRRSNTANIATIDPSDPRTAKHPRSWEEIRDIYASHIMHASNPGYFLIWHRLFLRYVEQKLTQAGNSPMVIPYYDITTDAGEFHKGTLWQANYFGGDGVGIRGCVSDHPFGDMSTWVPCIRRMFNTSVGIPSMLEVSHILKTERFEELSNGLQALAGYIHAFVGGTMESSSAAYDPVFLSVYAYVDMLFWRWQLLHPNAIHTVGFPDTQLEPFGLTMRQAFSSTALCVTYLQPGEGRPCNVTRVSVEVFPYVGYGPDGFDNIGYNRHGYNRHGYGRDGYNQTGYDSLGFDRYGFDQEGYNIHGYDRYGFDRWHKLDLTDRYTNNLDCFCRNRKGLTEAGFDRFGYDVAGRDVRGCDFGFRGPHAPRHVTSLWRWLILLPPEVLANLGRTCPALTPVSHTWWRQCWVSNIPTITGLMRPESPRPGDLSQRLCWEAGPHLASSCACPQGRVSCAADPCEGATCGAEPEARCHMTTCGRCGCQWVLHSRTVDCQDPDQPRAPCDRNPCLNGGTCKYSRWQHRTGDLTCVCPPHFEGALCERPASQVCQLLPDPGECRHFEDRWYYDKAAQTCRVFRYGGCRGNGNSFPTRYHCLQRCQNGACCIRKQLHQATQQYGYTQQGYDRYGFDSVGRAADGSQRTQRNGIARGEAVFDTAGYDWQGYDQDGYDPEGWDAQEYDREGYNRQGFNHKGYNREGDYDGDINFTPQSYNNDGYNRAGVSCHGFTPDGVDSRGFVSGYTHTCTHLSRDECQVRASKVGPAALVSFTPGVTCNQVQCGEDCGCKYDFAAHPAGSTFLAGCGLIGSCGSTGRTSFSCNAPRERKEIRDLTPLEWSRFHTAVRRLSIAHATNTSKWEQYAELLMSHAHHLSDELRFLPWLRYFIHQMEAGLQEVDCSVTIPYFDWTVDAGNMTSSQAWQANAFGGNGAGNEGHCVVRHPFQNPFNSGWSPCLRRQFSQEHSPLPHSLHIQRLLRDPDYTSFSRQLLRMSDLFRNWVGGHMTSAHASYDPVFLSHAAYMDKLWNDWQLRHPVGLFTFPSDLRFVPMAPFGMSSDDVFSSEAQLCVRYVPLTLGMPCIRPSEENKPVPALEFDLDGWDVEGYNRSGFDSQGFDRAGFNKDGINRDGFGHHGYDIDGFTRLGLNSEGFTPQGLDTKGSHLTDSAHEHIYDRAGYNHYGFNKYGYDRSGFDAFGFNASGFDRDGCNWYKDGPFYILHKVALDRTLEGMSLEELNHIPVSCPHMPGWHNFPRASAPPRSRFAISELWLPLLPEARLCILPPTQTGCSVGVAESPCNVDLCLTHTCTQGQGRTCWTRGCGGTCLAVWYDVTSGETVTCKDCSYGGQHIKHGEEVPDHRDSCSVCRCDAGSITCQPQKCPPVNCLSPRRDPGQCCLVCDDDKDGCTYGGRAFVDGNVISMPERPCEECRCLRGRVKCARVACPLVDCVYPMQSDCCPSCTGCSFGGEQYNNGDRFPDPRGAPCYDCTCLHGNATCGPIQCPETSCSHPALLPGECCPKCKDCDYDGQHIKQGEVVPDHRDPCSVCRCDAGSISCQPQQCPPVNCLSPRREPNQCCLVCDNDKDGCIYGGQAFVDGNVIPVHGRPCEECRCMSGSVKCARVACPLVDCVYPVQSDCCPSCTGCSFSGKHYNNGDRFPDPRETPCYDCTCLHGNITCGPIQCLKTACSHPALLSGKCCPKCKDCDYGGQHIKDGTVVPDHKDLCSVCRCDSGSISCQPQQCPPVNCLNPRREPNQCCLVCDDDKDGCMYGGQAFMDGSVIAVPGRPCEECRCMRGRVQCARVTCPLVDCVYPMLSDCCPSCDGCSFSGEQYNNGDQFPDSRGDPCYDCTCLNGNITCGPIQCPKTACSHPALLSGKCCPKCKDCSYRGQHIKHGEEVPDHRDPCSICHCYAGSISCQPQQCPPVNCLSPRRDPNQCCLVCDDIKDGCTYDGQVFSEGSIVALPSRECEECRCHNQRIECVQVDCPQVTCSYPVPGECCPSCQGCHLGDETYEHEQRFPDPRGSPCYECTCNHGNVTCDHVTCPRPTCPHPIALPDQCCPSCTDCSYEGQLINDGDSVSLPGSPCTVCKCRAGRVTCDRTACPSPACTHPAPPDKDLCCPTCNACLYQGVLLEHGAVTVDLLDVCSQCVCAGGTVTCSKSCSPPTCTHPAPGGTCGCLLCEACLWRGEVVGDREQVPHHSEPCSTCTCQSGSVSCGPVACPAVTCPPTTLPPGECCPLCPTTCYLHERPLEEGQQVTHPHQPCNTCTCQDGKVLCSARRCESAQCSHPAQDDCECPSCLHCLHNHRLVTNGSTFSPDHDHCLRCLCQDGTVTCERAVCPTIQCTSRAVLRGQCCPVCLDCELAGEVHHNGDVFSHPREPCQVCTCKDGEVQCAGEVCAPAHCTHPGHDACCPVCDDCLHGDRIVRNNQEFNPSPCELCNCQVGNITCVPVTCPALDCVETRQVTGECCPVCVGCESPDGGAPRPEGSSWWLSAPSCQVCQCYQGVTVCSTMPCLEPCPAPITHRGIRDENCCPVCSGCQYNGVQYTEGQRFSPTADPCDVCYCLRGNLQCYHESCATAHLCEPASLQPPLHDTCCPVCTKVLTRCEKQDVALVVTPTADPCFTCECTVELTFTCHMVPCAILEECPQRYLITEPGTCCPKCSVCFIPTTGELLPTGETWADPLNACHTCTCQDGVLACSMTTCRPMACQEGLVLRTRPGECCLRCTKEENEHCQYGNITHKHGTRWRIDECTECECGESREVACRTERCPPNKCSPSQSPSLMPGECCPVCITKPATCTAFGDPHYQTFDGQLVTLQGTCSYTMAADCSHGNFSVIASHDDRGTNGAVSWVAGIVLKLNSTDLDLLSRDQVKVNGTLVHLPYLQRPLMFVERSGSTLLVSTNLGVKITWDAGSGHVEVSVPGTYQGGMCGLCGNFNSFPQDDLTTRGGVIVTSVATFGNSWAVPSDKPCSDAVDIDTCAKAGYRMKRLANTKCATIMTPLFAPCHRVVAPQPYFASCVYDLCACADPDACLCDAMSAYALACAQSGVTIKWRSTKLCAIGCPEDLGFVFDECGPRCVITCENRHVTGMTSQCLRPCVPGCQCPAHLVLHQGRCIPEVECPAITFTETHRKAPMDDGRLP